MQDFLNKVPAGHDASVESGHRRANKNRQTANWLPKTLIPQHARKRGSRLRTLYCLEGESLRGDSRERGRSDRRPTTLHLTGLLGIHEIIRVSLLL